MIGRSLSERYEVGPLPAERAVSVLEEALVSHAKPIVEVRVQDACMVACLFVRADMATVRLCRRLGFDLKRGGTGVFGLLGDDVVKLLPALSTTQKASLAVPCGPRETKVLLLASGIALLSLVTTDGQVAITAIP